MERNRVWIRALLGVTLVAACLAAAIAPALTMVQAAPPAAPALATSLPPGSLVINSFRFSGSNAAGELTDEYIEIYNRSCDTAVDLSGYELKASDDNLSQLIYKFPAGSSLPKDAYYLITGNTYSDTTTPAGTVPAVTAGYSADGTPISYDINEVHGGVALFDNTGAQVDAAGYAGVSNGYFEGTAITAPADTTSDQGFFRKTLANQYLDSNNNAGDFARQDPSAAPVCGVPPDVTISGRTGTGSATLTWTGKTGPEYKSDATTGAYTITVPANWTGTVTPSKTGYTFNPPSKSYSNITTNQADQNYTATLASTFNPRVIINEVAWYGTQANVSADWIELYNPSSSDVDLSGWTLEAQDGIPTIELTGIIRAGGYYLLAHTGTSDFATSTPTPGSSPACQVFRPSDGVTINQYFTGDLEYLGETLFLLNPGGAAEDYANRNGGAWPAGSTSLSRSMERHGVTPDTDGVWFTYNPSPLPTPFVHDCNGNRVYGSPGSANWAGTVTATPSPTPTRYRTPTPFPPTPFGHMTINEFLPRAGYDWNQDGKVDVYDEFVELYNLGPVNANLSGWKIDVISPGGNTSYNLTGTLKPGERLLLYGLKSKLALHDLGGTVRLINNRGVIIDARGYDPVAAPDQSTCRIPEGQYWTFPCFPTPGNENSLTGTHPVPPPAVASQPPPCVMSDVIPAPFRQAECYPFGAGVYNPAYWDDQAGFQQFTVPDMMNKWRAVVQ